MKRINYILLPALALLFAATACSEKEEIPTTEERTPIEGIHPMMEGMASSSAEASSTRGTLPDFSVNKSADPTKKSLADRGTTGWKMDLTLYNGSSSYAEGSFAGASYNNSKWEAPADKYFPNYKKPQAEVLLYPTTWTPSTSTIDIDQSSDALLLAQDVLAKAKGAIEVAHTPTITLNHKHSMLDFVIKDVAGDVTVTVELGSTSYTPYKVSAAVAKDLEYMLILPEDTQTNPVIKIVTGEGDNQAAITYRQTINITANGTTSLGSNNCYCFTLQGAELKISPVTVLNWATGKSLPGEYIAVTAYPTFKAEGYANKTFYFYYDNKLKENGKEKLQEIKFNENAECTIKPDGRILTHIYKADEVEEIGNGSINKTPKAGAAGKAANITLGKMVIELTSSDLPN